MILTAINPVLIYNPKTICIFIATRHCLLRPDHENCIHYIVKRTGGFQVANYAIALQFGSLSQQRKAQK